MTATEAPAKPARLSRDEDLRPRTWAALEEEAVATVNRHPTADAAAAALRTLRRREVLRLAIGAIVGVTHVETLGPSLADITTRAEPADDGLRQLPDVPVPVEGVLDLLVGDRGGVDADEALDLAHPWLSPGQAPTRMLEALPDDIVMFCCEWDMLREEGERFSDKLRKDLGKRVHHHTIAGVPHGFDKAPNPLRESPGARQQYLVACKELRRMFELDEDEEDGSDHGDLPCKKHHKSVDMGKLQVPPR